MDNLVQAVRDVRNEVQAGETLADAIAFVAEERKINPVLLARKVSESHAAMTYDGPIGQPPEPVRQRNTKVTTMDEERAAHRAKVAAMTPEQRAAHHARQDAAFARDMRALLRLLTR